MNDAPPYRAPDYPSPIHAPEVIHFQEPGVVFTSRYLAVNGQSMPLEQIRALDIDMLPGNMLARAIRFGGWCLGMFSCFGCLSSPGFYGLGVLVGGAFGLLVGEALYRAMGGPGRLAVAVQSMTWQVVRLPLPATWRIADAEQLVLDVRKQLPSRE